MLNGKRIKELRLARGMSVLDLAAQAGLTRDGVYKLEAGHRGVGATAQSVARLAQALDTTADFLLGLSESSLRASGPALDVRPDLRRLVERLNRLPLERREQFSAIANALLASWQD